jgi:hypothetical protein
MEQSEFEHQSLKIENSGFRIELKYESQFSEENQIEKEDYNQKVKISESESSNIEIRIFKESNEINSGLITGINGGTWLSKATEKENGQSVKFKNGNLILSLGFNLVSIQIPTLEINWNIKPDPAEIFEFYNLENDILLRGELQIHRIDLNGNIKWSYGGRDIWVNIEGKPEVTILENEIRLIDFGHDEYIIDFKGNTIRDIPSKRSLKLSEVYIKKKRDSNWWKFWEKK